MSIDTRTSTKHIWEVWANSGTVKTNYDVLSWAKEVVDRGAGEIMVTAIELDEVARIEIV